jgi:hypothetical protein
MTSEHLSALLQAASATTDAEGWQHPADGRSITLHLAHDGASLAISRINSVRVSGTLVHAKSTQGETYVVSLDDLYVGSVEGPRDVARKAGFA